MLPLWALMPAIAIVGVAALRNEARHAGRGHAAAIFRIVAMCACLAVMGARPMLPTGTEYETNAVDVVFAVDDTLSMDAQDAEYDGRQMSRLQAAREVVSRVMERMPGCSYAIMKFDDSAQLLSPLTTDTQTITDSMDTMQRPDELFADGTSLGRPVSEIGKVLASASKRAGHKTCIVVISDGESTESGDADYTDLRRYVDSGIVVGTGSEMGSTMPSRYGGNIKDYSTGEDGITYLDMDALEKMGRDLQVTACKSSDTGKIDRACDDMLNGAARTMSSDEAMLHGNDVGWALVPAVFALAAWHLLAFVRRYA